MPSSRSRSASPETTEPETPSPSPSPDPTPTSPLFSASQSAESPPTTEDSPQWSGDPVELPGDGADFPATPSAPRSTGRAKLRAIKETVKAALITASGAAHQLLTREGTPERDAGLWLPDDEDLEAISDPLAGLASRRAPSGVDNPDVTDLVRLALGVVGYATKQFTKRAEAWAAYAPTMSDDPRDVHPGDGPAEDTAPPVEPWNSQT